MNQNKLKKLFEFKPTQQIPPFYLLLKTKHPPHKPAGSESFWPTVTTSL